jgi:hypothetical protein
MGFLTQLFRDRQQAIAGAARSPEIRDERAAAGDSAAPGPLSDQHPRAGAQQLGRVRAGVVE